MTCSILKSIEDNLFPIRFYTNEVVGWYTKGCNDVFGFEVYFPVGNITISQLILAEEQIKEHISSKMVSVPSNHFKEIPLNKVKMISCDLHDYLVKSSTSLVLLDF